MYGKMKITIILWLMCLCLCGCTRREQLVLEEASAFSEQTAADVPSDSGADDQAETADGASGLTETAKEDASGDFAALQGADAGTIFVHVCGAVNDPDVYELASGSRVYEAVRAAGGFTADADTNYVNQAQKLSDGVKLVIPTREQTAEQTEEAAVGGIVGAETVDGDHAEGAAADLDDRININTASEEELCRIPGIGATRAAAIVAYRQEKGGFDSIEDIMNVSGIKEGTYEKIRESIRTE